MRRAAAAIAKLETLFWKSEASFSFEKYLTRLSEAFKELEDAGQPLSEAQKVNHLLKGSIQSDDIQVQTAIGIARTSFTANFVEAFLALSRTAVSSRFASVVESNKQKRRIGAVDSRAAGNRGCRGRGRNSGGRSNGGRDNNRMRVVMNGVDVTDTSRNFTSDQWDKLRACGGHTYVAHRREYLRGRHGGRGDRGGARGGRHGRYNDSNHSNASNAKSVPRNVSTTNTTNNSNNGTEIVEYYASLKLNYRLAVQ